MKLPQWAIDGLRAHAPIAGADAGSYRQFSELSARIEADAAIVTGEVARELDALSDDGKRVIFEQAIFAAKYLHPPTTLRIREAAVEKERLEGVVREKAAELASLVRQLRGLQEEFGLPGALPMRLGEYVTELEDDPRYFAWARFAAVKAMSRETRNTSQPTPSLEDMLDILSRVSYETEEPLGGAVSARRSDGDPVRVMLMALNNARGHPSLPQDFEPSDRCISALVRLAFGVERTVDAVKMTRLRNR